MRPLANPQGESANSASTLLRIVACGSVDDGKSTLIGRLLFECNSIFEDQLSELRRASRKYGTTGEDIDFALLLDGLEAEREQGITIDVAYRYFSTARRKFIVADTPGHEEYTRNMATGASHSDVAIILVDARKGVLPANQTPCPYRITIGNPACHSCRQQDGSRGFFWRPVCGNRGRISPVRRETGLLQGYLDPALRAFGRQCNGAQHPHGLVRGTGLLGHLENLDADTETAANHCVLPFNG